MRTKAPSPGPHTEALVQLLRTADTIWDASRLFFERWSLGPSQFNVLNLLHGHPAGLSQTDLSRQLIMHRSNVTGLVDRLERRGLVQREEVAGDRRAYRVVLTATGARLLREILPRYHQGAAELWDGLPAKRVARLIADLARVVRNAERIAAHPPRGRRA